MTFHLSAIAREGATAIPASLRTAATVHEAVEHLAALAAAYPASAHVFRVSPDCRCCEEERTGPRMLAAARNMPVEIVQTRYR